MKDEEPDFGEEESFEEYSEEEEVEAEDTVAEPVDKRPADRPAVGTSHPRNRRIRPGAALRGGRREPVPGAGTEEDGEEPVTSKAIAPCKIPTVCLAGPRGPRGKGRRRAAWSHSHQ